MMRAYLVVLVVIAVAGASCNRHTTRAPRQLDAEQVADRARPATVTIVSQFDVTVEVAEFTPNEERLIAAIKSKLSDSNPTKEQVYTALFDVLYDDPERFLVQTTNTRSLQERVTARGTGLVVTPDGYAVTNAHVIEPGDDELKRVVVASVGDLVEKDLADLRNGVDRLLPGSAPTAEAEERMKKALFIHYAKTSHLANLTRTVYALMGYTKSGGTVDEQRIACEVKRSGKPIPGKDVAILKMEGQDFPTLPLASDIAAGGVRTGATLYVLGYPGAVSLDPAFSLPSRLEPSLSSGHVSGIKDMTDGWRVIQTDAAINPGNSGGPALNDKGEVVGLATFKIRGEENGPDTEGLNFIVSIDVVNEFLRELNVTPRQSRFTAQYLMALDDYEGQRSDRGLKRFEALSAVHPESSAVQEFVHQLSSGQTREQPVEQALAVAHDASARTVVPSEGRARNSGGVVILGLIGGLLAVIVIVVVLVNRN